MTVLLSLLLTATTAAATPASPAVSACACASACPCGSWNVTRPPADTPNSRLARKRAKGSVARKPAKSSVARKGPKPAAARKPTPPAKAAVAWERRTPRKSAAAPDRPVAPSPHRPVEKDARNAAAPGKPAPARIVILDAGHGGRDSGKEGPHGVLEKDITLMLARDLADVLRDRGYEVHLTRDADTLISLADRPRFANEWKRGRPRAIFVSIHCNAGEKGASGFETYFLSDARTEDERRVAEMENAAARFEDRKSAPGGDVDLILQSLRNDYYVRASDDLAELVQQRLGKMHPGPDRGVKQAGFRVLVGAIMPAVLVETAFMSNPREEQLLADEDFRASLVKALAAAIDRFFERHAWAAGAGD